MPAPIVETVYLLCRKSCAWFQYICQVKNPDEKNTRYVNLMGNNINKPLVHWGGGGGAKTSYTKKKIIFFKGTKNFLKRLKKF